MFYQHKLRISYKSWRIKLKKSLEKSWNHCVWKIKMKRKLWIGTNKIRIKIHYTSGEQNSVGQNNNSLSRTLCSPQTAVQTSGNGHSNPSIPYRINHVTTSLVQIRKRQTRFSDTVNYHNHLPLIKSQPASLKPVLFQQWCYDQSWVKLHALRFPPMESEIAQIFALPPPVAAPTR